MEVPVMTSPSTHRLRSAVGVCAKAGHSYLKPSHYSGSCLKIIKKSEGGNFLNKLGYPKKKSPGSDCKKNKSASNKASGPQCFAPKKKLKCLGLDRIGEEYAKVLLDSFPERLPAIPGKEGSSPYIDDKNNNNNNNSKKNDNDDRNSSGEGATNPDVDCDVSVSGDSGELGQHLGLECMLVPKRQPATKRTAQISREVYRVWQARVGSSSYATAGQVPLLLKDLQQFDSKYQVQKRLERAGRWAATRISFEEFCSSLVACNGKKLCDTGIPRTSPTPGLVGKDGNLQRIRRNRKLPRTMCKYEVFLGGSCNPTTWRTEIAIPNLQRMGITYFNPQVSQWKPDLLEVEYQAKESAAVMFFVIDNQTRGISALIEVAHIAGTKRKLILVIQSYTEEKQMICGEAISQEEYEDLRHGQEVLRDLVESQGIPVFDDINAALECTQRVLRENVPVQELDLSVSAAPARCPPDESINVRQAFDALATSDCSELDLGDACLALRLLQRRHVSLCHVENLVRESGLEISLEEQKMNFQQFCSLQAELLRSRGDEDLLQGYHQGTSECDAPFSLAPGHAVMRDVYLGGTSKDTSWKEEIAIPMLKENRLSYFNPKVFEQSRRFSQVQAAAMSSSYVLLFVITNSARSVAEMAMAGHYIGLGVKMVLCVQQLPEEAVLGPEKLSDNALKDYNRGRMYLADIAKRNGVAVFSDIRDAVSWAVEECKQR